MDTSYLLFFFASLGAFNGLALAAWLMWRPPVTPARRWLAALVLMLSVRTGKSVLFYFWPEVSKLVLQIGLSACFLIGPCLIGFLRAWGDSTQGIRTRRDVLWIVALLSITVAFGALYPYSTHTALWQGPVWRSIQYWWLACLLWSATILLQQERRLRQKPPTESFATLQSRTVGLAVTAGVTLVWAAYFWAGWTSYIAGALSFTLLVCLSISVAAFRLPATQATAAINVPYEQRRIAPAEAEPDLLALHRLMAEEHVYRDPGLTLHKLARRLGMPPARLSQLLNDNQKISFRQYLTQLRIDAAKQLLGAPEPRSMEQVAEASGFISMSTFYGSFKKVEGVTPAAWRQARSHEKTS